MERYQIAFVFILSTQIQRQREKQKENDKDYNNDKEKEYCQHMERYFCNMVTCETALNANMIGGKGGEETLKKL